MDDLEIEESKPIEETFKFKVVKDVMNGVDPLESFKKHRS